jgi:uncharacterized protein YgiM (DUF1202 family)
LTLALSACASDEVATSQEPVANEAPPVIPDAPGDAGETSPKPAGQGQAGEVAATPQAPAAAAPAPAAVGDKTVVPGALNVRSGPGMDQPVVRTIPKGAKVQTQSCALGWCKIGESEYVGSKHLE